MTPLLMLAARSAWSRRGTLLLVATSVGLATFLLLSIERMRTDIRASFSNAVSGTDLVVGARTGSIQLMLYTVFRIGAVTNNIQVESLRHIAQHRSVAWVVPLSLGDSHHGFPVLGTVTSYFEHFRYGDGTPLQMHQGRQFRERLEGLYEAVIGAEVARRLGYFAGDKITLSHGQGIGASSDHDDKPFTVVGILERTGTPVDRTVHVSLQSLQAIHLDWVGGSRIPGFSVAPEQARKFDLEPREVTSALVGLRTRAAVFRVQRDITGYDGEPLMAVLPGVALDELWGIVGVGERALLAISAMVGVVSLAGLVAVVLAGLNERRRELAVLRAVGASPRRILVLLVAEGFLVTLLGVAGGCALALAMVALAGPWVQSHFGISMSSMFLSRPQWFLIGSVMVSGVFASLLPALRAYRLSLADGLAAKV